VIRLSLKVSLLPLGLYSSVSFSPLFPHTEGNEIADQPLIGMVAITTVGYGEIIPRSVLGRLFTVPLLVFGLLLIALPSFVLGRNFAIVFDAMQHQLAQPVSQGWGFSEGRNTC
jgi:hypothetical protein